MAFSDKLSKFLVTNKQMPSLLEKDTLAQNPAAPPQPGTPGLAQTFEPTKRKTFNQNLTGMMGEESRQSPYYDTGETMDAGNPIGERPTGFTEHVANLRKQMIKNKPPFQEERTI